MNLVTKENLLETILFLSDEIKDLRNSKFNMNKSNEMQNRVINLSTDSSDSSVLSAMESFSSFSKPEIFSPFISDNEYDSGTITKSENIKNTIYFHEVIDLFISTELLSCHINNDENTMLSIVSKMLLKNSILSEFSITLFQPSNLRSMGYKIGKANLIAFYWHDDMMRIASENLYTCENFEYIFVKESYNNKILYTKCKHLNHLYQQIHWSLDLLICYIKEEMIYYQKLGQINSVNMRNNNLITFAINSNYLISNFAKSFSNHTTICQDIITFQSYSQPCRICYSTIIKITPHRKRSNSFQIYLSNPDEIKTMSNVKFIVENSNFQDFSKNDSIKNSSSQTLMNRSNILTDSEHILSHFLTHNCYLDYLHDRIIERILNIIKTNTNNYLLLKYEIILSKEYELLSDDKWTTSQSSKSSKDKTFLKGCEKSKKIRRKKFKKCRRKSIHSKRNEKFMKLTLENSISSLSSEKECDEKLLINSEQCKIHNKINKNKNAYTPKTEIKSNKPNSNEKSSKKNVSVLCRSISVNSMKNKLFRIRKSIAGDSSTAKNCFSKKIDLFLKEYSSEYSKNHKQRNKPKKNYKAKKLFSSNRILNQINLATKNPKVICNHKIDEVHFLEDSESRFLINDSNISTTVDNNNTSWKMGSCSEAIPKVYELQKTKL